ncbi:hypothetical protein DENSPDRAFT_552647 [Dentipellis sp. KUC8613]|nr:hypothetical protein DENSPDRAFT_552647 [Dentipellis sp. KUC8613]
MPRDGERTQVRVQRLPRPSQDRHVDSARPAMARLRVTRASPDTHAARGQARRLCPVSCAPRKTIWRHDRRGAVGRSPHRAPCRRAFGRAAGALGARASRIELECPCLPLAGAFSPTLISPHRTAHASARGHHWRGVQMQGSGLGGAAPANRLRILVHIWG